MRPVIFERMYAKCANSQTTEVNGASHLVCELHPKKLAALIEQAANGVSNEPWLRR